MKKKLPELVYARRCSECKKGMNEGYYVGVWIPEYYCSDQCLHKHYTKEEYLQMHQDEDSEAYWTTWHHDEKRISGKRNIKSLKGNIFDL